MLRRKLGGKVATASVEKYSPAYCSRCGRQIKGRGGGNDRVLPIEICNRCKRR